MNCKVFLVQCYMSRLDISWKYDIYWIWNMRCYSLCYPYTFQLAFFRIETVVIHGYEKFSGHSDFPGGFGFEIKDSKFDEILFNAM